MAVEYRLRRSRRRHHHALADRPGRLRARAHDRRMGANPVRDDIPHLSGAADDPVYPVLAHYRDTWIAGFGVVAHPRLSELHRAVLHLASDGLLQGDPARSRGRSHDRRAEPVWRIHQGGDADFGCRDADGGDLYLHFGNARVCLRRDVYHRVLELYGERRRADLSCWGGCLFLGLAYVGPPD